MSMKKLLLSTITFAMMLTAQAQPANKTVKIKVISSHGTSWKANL